MNIHDLAARTGISLKILRKLEKINVLKLDPENALAAELRFSLSRQSQLSVMDLLTLLENPDIFGDLRQYDERAREQVARLGDVTSGAAPKHVTAEIPNAAKGDRRAALVIADWLKGILPAGPVGYHWVAARLLFPLNPFLRKENSKHVIRALLIVRAQPEFAGWWHVRKIHKVDRAEYFRAANVSLDM